MTNVPSSIADPDAAENPQRRLRDSEPLSRLIGDGEKFRRAIARLPMIARSDATVVISGETGTGKELVARAVHYLGARASQPFVPINCGALADSLLEDELFGHERGAFTDAKWRRPGLLSQADRGTLFLDEIDSLTPRAQAALLRVLQDRTYRTLGGTGERVADVRFVAATNTQLSSLVCAGRFRSDLYYRLYVFGIELPPLRERPEDILPLARHFIERHSAPGSRIRLTPDAERTLLGHLWPGNVRELENVIQRAVALTSSSFIEHIDLELAAEGSQAVSAAAPSHASLLVERSPDRSELPPFNDAKRAVLDAFEREYLERALRDSGGNVSLAARSAQKERRDFGRLIRKHRLDPRAFGHVALRGS